MDGLKIGFIGLGRLGFVLASALLEHGRPVVCCARGRSAELVAAGAGIAGDGSPRAVAEGAEALFTCLPAAVLEGAFHGADGVLAATGPLPTVVELSTADVAMKSRLRDAVAGRGAELLDAPVSGTPAMAAAGKSVIYASGDRQTYDQVAEMLTEMSPGAAYVGEFGSGTKMKSVANLLVLAHVAAASEAMSFAAALGLAPGEVAELLARSPAASSGQFAVRGPMIAARDFEGRLVTIADARENLEQITEAAAEVDAAVPLAATVKKLFDAFGDQGEDGSDPAKLTVFLERGAR